MFPKKSSPTKNESTSSLTCNSGSNKNLATTGQNNKTKTRITVKYDVGFNNVLYLRGQGANLSWDRGVALKNVKADEWVWETDANFSSGEFKVLINDRLYETGTNHPFKAGANINYTPKF